MSDLESPSDPLATPGPEARAIRVVLYTCAPADGEPSSEPAFAGLLSDEERARAARFRRERDRWSYSAAHALLRAMLAEFHSRPPLAWRFCSNAHGRPEVDLDGVPVASIRFNLSHADGLAACAMTVGSVPDGVEVGVDAECLDRRVDAVNLAERFFSATEARWLRGLPETARNREFLRLWTLKEAVAKATGRGLALDIKSFDCRLSPAAVRFEEGSEWKPDDLWTVQHWTVPPRHGLSLALRRPAEAAVSVDVRHLADWDGGPLPDLV